MLTQYEVAQRVTEFTDPTADRYHQIAAIKKVLTGTAQQNLATDREFIDNVLDTLFDAFGYSA